MNPTPFGIGADVPSALPRSSSVGWLIALFAGLALLAAGSVSAQSLTVYDDALQNGFLDYSYGGGSDFNSTLQPHTGTKSISFTGNNYNAVAFARPATPVNTAQYPVVHFWVHGGASGGQKLRFYVRLGAGAPSNVALDTYIAGGSIAANAWREVTVDLTQAPLSYNGSYDRIDLQSDIAPAQTILYIDDVTLTQAAPVASAPLLIEHGVNVSSMLSDRFTWRDSNNQPRVAVLAFNDPQSVGSPPPNDPPSRGGALREFRYQLPNGVQRVAGLTGYGIGDAGFGYVVSHSSTGACAGHDDSPIGGLLVGNGWERIFEGRHHAIFRFHQNYPRNCTAAGLYDPRTVPVTIDWMFTTGHDNPEWSITYDIDLASPATAFNTLNDDSRAPYGELAIDGNGFTNIDGVAWGDRYKFTSLTAPVTLDSDWNWQGTNTVPYVKEWLAGPLSPTNTLDATMGIVQTQTNAQQDAAGGREAGITAYWGKTSVAGNACGARKMPCANNWPYQANANSLDYEYTNPGNPTKASVNARLTWKTQYGFIGQQNYALLDGTGGSAPGWPKKSYSTYIVLGTHTSSPVEAQLAQVEAVQTVTFTPTIGTVVLTGPAGNVRADTVTYAPAGYNHVYGALALRATGNQIDMNIALGAGKTLKKPLIIVSNYTAGDPQTVRIDGAALVADAGYFASVRPAASELWITLNRDFSGAVNRLEIIGGGALATPANFVATASSASQVALSWNAVAGATYEVWRSFNHSAFALLIATAATNYTDAGLAADTTYLYEVRSAGAGGPSPFSPIDPATTTLFTDDPLNAGTVVKAVHITQLRTAVNAMRAAAGLAAQVFTDPGLAAGTPIKAVHINELRTALDEARALIPLVALGYTDSPIAATVTSPKTLHVTELRNGVK